MASSYFLPRLVGASLAAEMILTGRFIDAGRALSAGLVSEIVDEDELLDRGIALAGEMLATSPHGLRLSKQALNLNIDAPSLEAAMAIEDRQQVILSATEDHREELAAFKSEEHTSELQSLMRTSYAVFCLKKKNNIHNCINKT